MSYPVEKGIPVPVWRVVREAQGENTIPIRRAA
jgi:hypothetical protein